MDVETETAEVKPITRRESSPNRVSSMEGETVASWLPWDGYG